MELTQKKIVLKNGDPLLIITIKGSCGNKTDAADCLHGAFLKARRAEIQYIAFDIRSVEYVGSDLISVFAMAHRASCKEGGAICILAPSRNCVEKLTVTHLNEVLLICDAELEQSIQDLIKKGEL
jgi:anti-anti-sigma regulatory factor